jgi:amino-acid N-acetyltransferase
MNHPIQIRSAQDDDRNGIIELLEKVKLPINDLPAQIDQFLIVESGQEITAVVGLEKYEDYGLLRSLAVDPLQRGKHLAVDLVKQLEENARNQGVRGIYLLTETAAAFFEKQGYQKIERNITPAALQQSSQFSYICPQSATVMKKDLL